jgi:hypothetical protein
MRSDLFYYIFVRQIKIGLICRLGKSRVTLIPYFCVQLNLSDGGIDQEYIGYPRNDWWEAG